MKLVCQTEAGSGVPPQALSLPPPDLAQKLLPWYRASRRDLPWRARAHDAYAIWISEIMLQQTTVAAVIPFYERWMQSFPTIEALHEAPLDDVLRHWAGLGYYARARNIKKAATVVVERFGGRLPSTLPELLQLPGIGRYTAGAIASIAYGVKAPILDANVVRVLSRLFTVSGDPKSGAVQRRLWQLAEEVIPADSAGDFNQALMELGALVCLPAAPKCSLCPVAGQCAALAEGEPTRYPELSKPKAWQPVDDCAVALENNGQVLLIRRREEGLWGGLWELPRASAREGEPWEACAARAIGECVGLAIADLSSFGSVRHTVMNRRITLHGFAARGLGRQMPRALGCDTFAWAGPHDLPKYALSSPQQRLLALWSEKRIQPALEYEQ